MNDAVRMMIERGVPVIPIVAGTKRPFFQEWQRRASADATVVQMWADEFPNCSWAAVATASSIFILDDDSFVVAHMGGVAPDTFVVSSSPGHLQWYFKQTDASREMGAITQPESGGRFSIRFNNQYGIFYGKHPDGHDYEIVNDAPIIEAPDELIAYLRSFAPDKKVFTAAAEEMEYEDSDLRRITPKLMDAFVAHYTLKTRGFATGKWFIACPWESEHSKFYSETETAILLNNGSAGFKCMHGCCKDWGWAAFRKQCEDTRASGVEKFNFFHAKVERLSYITANAVEQKAPRYPIEVWDGTIYGEYAELASAANFIPPFFHLEALKTVAGALVGNGLKCQKNGVTPRFYTVLLTGAQGGKGTALDWAIRFFEDYIGAETMAPLLWGSQEVEMLPKTIGAARVSFGSDVGMQNAAKRQQRWLQVYEEISTLFERAGIQGSGQSLIAANRQLYDTEVFTVTETAKRAGFSGKAQNSILAATTPSLWSDMFTGTQSAGSGIFQRLSVIAFDGKIKRVAMLDFPPVRVLQARLISKILELEEKPVEFFFTLEAQHALSVWFGSERFQDGDPEHTGRLNIIAMRNALHLAWMHNTNGKIDELEVEGGIALADYQYEIRKTYQPNSGDNVFALMQSKIRRALSNGKLSKAELRRIVHADRVGTRIFNDALQGMLMDDVAKTSDGRYEFFSLRGEEAA